jgi:crotonobetainyl-CoA:carnitine CoA-transferase CaiB-like acyl-CoA transferase
VIEPPGGNPLRREPDLWHGLAAGKRSVTLDIRTATGQSLFRKMAEEANLVIESFAPGTLESLGLGFAALQGIKRRIIVTSITPFGQAEQSAAGRPPQLDANAKLLAGLNAFAASAIAAHNADAYEVPQHIDIAISAFMAVGGSSGTPSLESPPFTMSEVEWEPGETPAVGEHNEEIFWGELGLAAADLALLRAAGVI